MDGTRFAFEAIGTSWKIDITDALDEQARNGLLVAIKERIAEFDKNYSRFRDDSLVMEIARRAGTYALPPDAAPMLKMYEDAYRLTGGAVTPLIGQVLVDAGYDAQYSLRPKPMRMPPSWNDALDFQPPATLIVKQPALLDFGAMGKGYLIDIVGRMLHERGLRTYCIDAGGDILQRHAQKKILRVGLEDPTDFEKVIGVARIVDQSICGSAGNRRAWADFHHIIDPHTLASPRHLLAVWTVAATTMLADAMSTCLFFAPPEMLREHFRFEYALVHADRTITKSPDFPAEMFSA
jgi:thiamine biosynthesis lipoprotein